jgi:hypothetical protein
VELTRDTTNTNKVLVRKSGKKKSLGIPKRSLQNIIRSGTAVKKCKTVNCERFQASAAK